MDVEYMISVTLCASTPTGADSFIEVLLQLKGVDDGEPNCSQHSVIAVRCTSVQHSDIAVRCAYILGGGHSEKCAVRRVSCCGVEAEQNL